MRCNIRQSTTWKHHSFAPRHIPSTLFRLSTAQMLPKPVSQPKHRPPPKPCAEHTPKTTKLVLKLVCFRMPLISNRTLDLTTTSWLTTLNGINSEPYPCLISAHYLPFSISPMNLLITDHSCPIEPLQYLYMPRRSHSIS